MDINPYVQALLWGAGGIVIYLFLLKRLRKTHRPKDVPDIVLASEESETEAQGAAEDETNDKS